MTERCIGFYAKQDMNGPMATVAFVLRRATQSLVLWSRCTGTWDVGELGDDSGRRCSSNWPPVTKDVSPAESQSSVGAEEEA